jgi:hypothetical protein
MYVFCVSTPSDKNVLKKYAEYTPIYKDLLSAVECMCTMKVNMISVIVSATGSVSSSFQKYLECIAAELPSEELHEAAILRAVHILRQMLM